MDTSNRGVDIIYHMNGLRHHQTWRHVVPNCTPQPTYQRARFLNQLPRPQEHYNPGTILWPVQDSFGNDCLTRTLLKGKVNFVYMDATKCDAHVANLNLKGVLARFWVSRTSRMAG
jgi:hypothetical protein